MYQRKFPEFWVEWKAPSINVVKNIQPPNDFYLTNDTNYLRLCALNDCYYRCISRLDMETRPKDHHIDTLTSFACLLNSLLAASFPADPPFFHADRDLSWESSFPWSLTVFARSVKVRGSYLYFYAGYNKGLAALIFKSHVTVEILRSVLLFSNSQEFGYFVFR